MHRRRTNASLLLIALIAAAIFITVNPAVAQSTPKPSVPQFSVEPSAPSFDIPPTYSFNASSGLFYANDGYHIEYSIVNIVIKNQPFTAQASGDYLYYNVRIKPHNYPDSYWQELFSAGADGYPIQTKSDYTTIPLAVEGAQQQGVVMPTGASTDIQVEAMIGHIGRNQTMTPYPYPYVFFGETSGWSSTQTVTLPPKEPFSASPSPVPSTTPLPSANGNLENPVTVPLYAFVVVVVVFALVIGVLSVLLFKQHRQQRSLKR